MTFEYDESSTIGVCGTISLASAANSNTSSLPTLNMVIIRSYLSPCRFMRSRASIVDSTRSIEGGLLRLSSAYSCEIRASIWPSSSREKLS